jgi:hypothetical protein
MADLTLSDHACHRSAQRNVSFEEIDFIVQHGSALRNTGVIFRQMRRKDLPRDLPANHPYRRLVGTTVVLCKCGHHVLTIYREGEAFHKDRCKRKYCQRDFMVSCPRCMSSETAA